MSKSKRLVLAIFFSVCFLLIWGAVAPKRSHAEEPAPEPTKEQAQAMALRTEAPEKTARREALIAKLTKRGIFYKIEKQGELPHVYVGRSFYDLPVDDKTSFLGVVLAKYMREDAKTDMLVLFDSLTGKEIGDFSQSYGLTLK